MGKVWPKFIIAVLCMLMFATAFAQEAPAPDKKDQSGTLLAFLLPLVIAVGGFWSVLRRTSKSQREYKEYLDHTLNLMQRHAKQTEEIISLLKKIADK